MYDELAILALFVFLYSVIAGRIERSAAASPPIAGYLKICKSAIPTSIKETVMVIATHRI